MQLTYVTLSGVICISHFHDSSSSLSTSPSQLCTSSYLIRSSFSLPFSLSPPPLPSILHFPFSSSLSPSIYLPFLSFPFVIPHFFFLSGWMWCSLEQTNALPTRSILRSVWDKEEKTSKSSTNCRDEKHIPQGFLFAPHVARLSRRFTSRECIPSREYDAVSTTLCVRTCGVLTSTFWEQ